jgi:hypothetical protein
MSEPISGTAAGIFSWKAALGFSALIGSGVLGGAIMAAFDPPKTRKLLFAQGAAAGIGSLFFGPLATRALDHYADWVTLADATPLEALETAMPVYLLIGTLSWGVFAALAKLREIIRERGAATLAEKLGVNKPTV